MKRELDLSKVTQTIEGYPVKNLTYKPIDNIIVGLVEDPDYNGQLKSVQWKVNGTLTHNYIERNGNRTELNLKMPV